MESPRLGINRTNGQSAEKGKAMNVVRVSILGGLLFSQSMLIGCSSNGIAIPGGPEIRNPFAKTPSPISELNDQEVRATGRLVTAASVYAMPLILREIDHEETRATVGFAIPLAAMGASYVAAEVVEERQKRYESEVALLDEEIELAEKTLAAKEAELASLRASIDRLQREIDLLAAQATRDEQSRKKAEATRETLRNQIEQNNAAIVRYNETIAYIDELLKEKAEVEDDQLELESRQTKLGEQRLEFVAQRDQLYAMILEQDRQYNQLEAIAAVQN